MKTAVRVWTGTPLEPTNVTPPHNEMVGDQCDHPNPEYCTLCRSYVVEISLRTADGRAITAYLTSDEADAYAAKIKSQAEWARALSR